jgi:hypothetical protein
LTVGSLCIAGSPAIVYLHAFLDYLGTLTIFQWFGLAAAFAAVGWSIWWAYKPDA